jgi:hypothetical protein
VSGFFQDLIKTLGAAAIVVAAVAWLAKSIITHILSRNIEVYKTELKRESDKEIEGLKSRLQIAAQERQIVFNRLHEKRAEIVAESYTLISGLTSRAVKLGGDIFHGGLRTPQQRAEEIYDECFKFYEYFQQRRIYFSEEVCETMDRFVNVIAETNATLRSTIDNLDHLTEDNRNIYKKMAILMDELPSIKKLIENDFRNLLGVITPKKSPAATISENTTA